MRTIILLILIRTIGYSQADTITKIEMSLLKKSTIIEIDRHQMGDFSGLYINAIYVKDTKSGTTTKGGMIGKLAFSASMVRNVYLDTDEVLNLVDFFEKCDKVWKTQTHPNDKKYSYSTIGGLTISFHTVKNTTNWNYILEFKNYGFSNDILIPKNKSDEFYAAITNLKNHLSN